MDGEATLSIVRIENANGNVHALYTMAREAGLTWDLAWIATEVEDGVILDWQDGTQSSFTLTVLGVKLSDLQYEFAECTCGSGDIEIWTT